MYAMNLMFAVFAMFSVLHGHNSPARHKRHAALRQTGTVDVKAKGAIGDAKADDTASFQAALSEAKSTHSAIYVPAGKYRITKPLAGFGGFKLTGKGPTSEIIYEHEQTKPSTWNWTDSLFVFNDGDTDIRFKDVKLSYKGTFSVGGSKESYKGEIAGIYLPMVHDVVIENIEATGFNSYGIHQTTANREKYATNVEVRKCRLHGNRVGGFRFDYVNGCRILDCDLYRNGLAEDPGTGYGLAGSSGGRPKNVLVRDCRVHDNKLTGIDFHVSDNVTIENNQVYADTNNGFGNQNGILSSVTFGTLRIIGNTIKTIRDRGQPKFYLTFAIHVGYSNYKGTQRNTEKVSATISGNTIEDFDVEGGEQVGYPILVDNSFNDFDLTIENNVIDAKSCLTFININGIPAGVQRNEVVIRDNKFKSQKIGYVPARVSCATDLTIERNVVEVASSDRPGDAVFSLGAPGRPDIRIQASGNTASMPSGWDRHALLPARANRSGAGNKINGSAAD